MAINLEKIRIMSKDKFEALSSLSDDELYFVEFTDYIKNIIKSALTLNLSTRQATGISNSNRTYTAPSDGTIIGSICVADNTSPVVNLTRNNSVYTLYKFQGSTNEVNTDEITFNVLKGDIITVSDGKLSDDCTNVYFYPINIEV